jgi:hypothetical protein
LIRLKSPAQPDGILLGNFPNPSRALPWSVDREGAGFQNFMKNIKIRTDTHTALKVIASQAGESLGEFADCELRKIAKLPPVKLSKKEKP